MQKFPELRKWLGNGISEDFRLLHGTSLESVFELSNSGKLPTGVLEPIQHKPCDFTEGRLFFVPFASELSGKRYERLKRMDRKECLRDAKTYARPLGFTHYFADRVNCQTTNTYYLIKSLERGDVGWEDVQNGLKKDGIGLSLGQIRSLYYHAKKRKGVIIEPKESVLEMPHKIISDDIIAVDCPEGLDKIHISGMRLLGPVEKGLMKRFLDGKYNYEGFRTKN